MEQFSYHFIATMLHSLWQSALLLVFFGTITLFKPRLSPLSKRNLLLSMLGVQVIYSLATFYFLATDTTQGLLAAFSHSVSAVVATSWLQGNAIFIFPFYILLVAGRLCSSSVQWSVFKKGYKRNLVKAPLDLRLFTQAKALHFGISQKVSLWCSSYVHTPMTFGFWKPVILLPVALLNQLSMQQTEALIIHELTHIRHKDYLLNLALVIAENLYFFNPFVWIIAKQLKMEREKNCDTQVIHFEYNHILYAEALLIASQMQQQLSLQMPAVKSKHQLLSRINFFARPENLDFQRSRRSLVLAGYAGTVLLTLMLLFVFTQKNTVDLPPIVSPQNSVAIASLKTTETTAIFKTEMALPIAKKVPAIKSIAQRPPSKTILSQQEKPVDVTMLPEDAQSFYAMPASSTETSLEGQEIIIKEERSDGRKITAAYYALLVDGLWTLQPLWLISETKAAKDSLNVRKKDSLIKIIPAVQ